MDRQLTVGIVALKRIERQAGPLMSWAQSLDFGNLVSLADGFTRLGKLASG
ncbi:MAG: hypothetical protein LAQ69_09090 [Acidobacteriia bacterium]|nr:hypothetical protein [Terriglobia bacterium]